ncbi:MAG: hypothetical protein IJI47_00605 [Eubacterium sp.]|nr:hypothetical protein [Eubacterium sp.]
MKRELPHYNIGSSYGGNQEWFPSFAMRMGGCAAETACEMCIYLDRYKGTDLYPFDKNNITKAQYARFGNIMKPYLHPRLAGVNRLSIFIDGFKKYLDDNGSSIELTGVEGSEDTETAKQKIIAQIDSEIPVPFLCLNHSNRRFKEYEWHWFLINGYDDTSGRLKIKAVTYSEYEWLDFEELWNTGRLPKGVFIILNS